MIIAHFLDKIFPQNIQIFGMPSDHSFDFFHFFALDFVVIFPKFFGIETVEYCVDLLDEHADFLVKTFFQNGVFDYVVGVADFYAT